MKRGICLVLLSANMVPLSPVSARPWKQVNAGGFGDANNEGFRIRFIQHLLSRSSCNLFEPILLHSLA